MKIKLVAALSLIAAAPAFAAAGIFGTYLEVTTTTTTVYKGMSPGSSPSLDGASLGIFDLADTLSITNASVNTFKNGTSDVTGANMFYTVYLTGSRPVTPSFTGAALSFSSNQPFTDLGGNSATGGGDQEWKGSSSLPVNLITAAGGEGKYTLEVYFNATSNDGTHFDNKGGANYTAAFTVIPEPSAALLGAIGSLVLLRRRR